MSVRKEERIDKNYILKIRELFRNTPMEGKLNYENLTAENTDLEKLYQDSLVIREELNPYVVDWNIGDILHTKDGKQLMIIQVAEAGKPYRLLNLESGIANHSTHHVESFKENWLFAPFNLVGEFDPKITKVEKYKY
jgi:hypothetical protein